MSRQKGLAIAIAVLCVLSFVSTAAATPAAEACGADVTRVVQAGDTVYLLAQRYGTTMDAIAAANHLADITLIYAGAKLAIPCQGGATNGTTAGTTVTIGEGADAVAVDCSNFAPSSPTDGLANSWNSFYWTAAPGAEWYRVNVYNADFHDGDLVASFDTGGDETQVDGDLTNVGSGFLFAWDVQAMVGDTLACTSKRAVTYRDTLS